MPMHISPSIDTDLSRTETMFPRMGRVIGSLSSATQGDILGILQREQDHAVALLSSSPLLASLFVSYANQAAALESASATPSPESEEWKALQNGIATLQEEIEKLKSENLETVKWLESAEASREAFRSQVLSLKDVNTTQQDDITSLRTELAEAKEKYDRIMVDSNTEKTTLQVQVLDLEAQRAELKEAVVEQQIKISKFERQGSASPPTLSTATMPTVAIHVHRQKADRDAWEEHEECEEQEEFEEQEECGELIMRVAREQAEREAKEQAERVAKEKAEREAREKAEREAREKAEREAREKAEREARDKAEREARDKAEREAMERAGREAKEKAEHEAREQAERKAREKAEREARERAERRARERAEWEAMEQAELKAREQAERAAKEKTDRVARRRVEKEVAKRG